jgi:CheY-like chemotaxis protein
MICDDEQDLLTLFRAALGKKYEVLTVDSGKKCIETYLREKQDGRKVDVLLLDYKLGDMLGDTVACQISQLNGVKTILISAYDLDEKMIQDLLDRKCIIGTMAKPIRLAQMLQKVDQVLNGSQN